MKVQLAGVQKSFGVARVLDGLDLDIAEGEFVTLLGPSGCGKTTTLRCIAGLENPDGGRITAGDRVFADAADHTFVPPHRRTLGMVFQSYALWPHMTVRSNVAYPMKRRKAGAAEIRRRVEETLAAVGMEDHAHRYPHELSGGQQQRVALARGLVSAGGLMLYDEPLSNLDARLRIAMRTEILRLHHEFGNTSLYVTHDQEEALALSDRVVIMNAGRIDQVGDPEEIHDRPASRFAADFVGFENVIETADGGATLPGELRVLPPGQDLPAGAAVAFRGKQVRRGTATGPAIGGRGVIRDGTYVGDRWTARLVTAGDVDVTVTVPDGADRFGRDGDEVDFFIPLDDVVVLTR